MTEQATEPVAEKLLGEVNKNADLTVRVRLLEADDERFIDIRDYVPSAELYGRGVLVPVDAKKMLLAAIKEA